jgi:hypothetical protein
MAEGVEAVIVSYEVATSLVKKEYYKSYHRRRIFLAVDALYDLKSDYFTTLYYPLG